MSLFDVIKYGSIDITNAKSLSELPEHILDDFWHYRFIILRRPSTRQMASIFYHLSDRNIQQSFIKFLEDYNEPV